MSSTSETKAQLPLVQSSFKACSGALRRTVQVNGHCFETDIACKDADSAAVSAEKWNLLRLSGVPMRNSMRTGQAIGLLDLFSGCGGFSLGATEAVEALGFSALHHMAVDLDRDALEVYRANLKPREIVCNSVTSLVNFQLRTVEGAVCFADVPSLSGQLQKLRGRVDLVIGGPPCQGHSGFNNKTRGDDPRNRLYYTVAAAAVSIKANMIVIENVARIVNDKERVVEKTLSILEASGYHAREIVCTASDYGVAQNRERHFLVASKYGIPPVQQVKDGLRTGSFGVYDAIRDLEAMQSSSLFDSCSILNEVNKERVDFLFDNDLFELPNHVRPDCHKDGHSYPSVYGRLRPDKPANTITTGFMSPGRGRYVHPTKRRCLTPHEAARLQGFPDSFRFDCPAVKQMNFTFLSKVIGDAVPPPLGFVPVMAVLLTHPRFKSYEQGQTIGEAAQAQAA
jgi:DNA (cytosine-5)-methyltransferase 1